MNPVRLKPGSDRRSHVVVMGRPAGEVSASDFVEGRRHLAAAAHAAYDDLASRFEVIVAEGAGSPAEINLRSSDYVNLGLARHADLPVVVVGDIDRGGLFAAMFGTLALLEPADQRLISGFVVNKFRGDLDLLRPGLDELTARTGRPVHGVLPWHPDLWLDSEDALDLEGRRSRRDARARVAVVRLPRISNFTDVDALGLEPDLDVVFVSDPRDLADADLVGPARHPGDHRRPGLAARSRPRPGAVTAHVAAGKPLLGLCGGFQMLGHRIADPDGVEGTAGADVEGLGLLPVQTRFQAEKVLRLPRRRSGVRLSPGTRSTTAGSPGRPGPMSSSGVRTSGRCTARSGTAARVRPFRATFLARILGLTPSGVSFTAARERRLDLLADLVEEHLDVPALLTLARDGAPDGLLLLHTEARPG